MPYDALSVARNNLDIRRLKKVSLNIERDHARNIDRRHSRSSSRWWDGLPILSLRSRCRWRLGWRGCARKIESRRRHYRFRFRQPRGDCLPVVQGKAGDYVRMNFTLEIKRLIESIESF